MTKQRLKLFERKNKNGDSVTKLAKDNRMGIWSTWLETKCSSWDFQGPVTALPDVPSRRQWLAFFSSKTRTKHKKHQSVVTCINKKAKFFHTAPGLKGELMPHVDGWPDSSNNTVLKQLLQRDSLFASYAGPDLSAENFRNLVMKNAWNQVKYTMSMFDAFNKHDNLLIFLYFHNWYSILEIASIDRKSVV